MKQPMPKGYWIIHAEVHHIEAFEQYRAKNEVAFANFEHRYLVRGGRSQCVEGHAKKRTVIIEFPDYETALACYDAPGSREARALRQEVINGLRVAEVDFIICEGPA